MSAAWGSELMVDVATELPRELLASQAYLDRFLFDAVQAANMVPWGKPHFQRLDNCPEQLVGYSAVQFIHTSSLTIHVCELVGRVYINLFSCGDFETERIMGVINDAFKPTAVRKFFVTRGI
jgi:S-adenosylmethionine/arginine decarboxylase-like enzyme